MNHANDQHLPFPFPRRTAMAIGRQTNNDVLIAELAASDIEIFQSACYRDVMDPGQPLVLQFGNPTIQNFSMQKFSVPLEQILVEYGTNRVIGIYQLKLNEYSGGHIVGFSGLSCVILSVPGFARNHDIETKNTFITLKTLNHAR